MDFEAPPEIADFLQEVDQFIEDKIRPLEIQMRRAAGYLFGFMKQQKPKGVS